MSSELPFLPSDCTYSRSVELLPASAPFPFLALPYEIRLVVYELIMYSEPIHARIPRTKWKCRNRREYPDSVSWADRIRTRNPHVDFLRVCRQIHDEAKPVMYTYCLWDIATPLRGHNSFSGQGAEYLLPFSHFAKIRRIFCHRSLVEGLLRRKLTMSCGVREASSPNSPNGLQILPLHEIVISYRTSFFAALTDSRPWHQLLGREPGHERPKFEEPRKELRAAVRAARRKVRILRVVPELQVSCSPASTLTAHRRRVLNSSRL